VKHQSDVTLRYFDGCPNWRTTDERLRAVLREEGLTAVEPSLERVETPEDAERLHFVGSPTVLIDGRDPFGEPGGPFGLTCRIYQTPQGLAGSPTSEQLREAIRSV
jgi:hypothetical protein